MKTIVYVLLIILTLSSCNTAKHASKDDSLQVISKNNFSLLKGTWKNIPIDNQLNKRYASTFDVNALQDVQLAKQFFLLDENILPDADRIQLLPVDNQLQVTAFRRNEITAKFSVKGKFKKGYFKTKKQSKTAFPPIPPFYYFNDNVRLYVTVDKENNLVIKRRGKKTGMIFFFASGFSMDNEYCYAPVFPIDGVEKSDEVFIKNFSEEDENTAPKLSGNTTTDKKLLSIISTIKKRTTNDTTFEKMTIDLDTGGEGGKATLYLQNDLAERIEKVVFGEAFRTETAYYFDDNSGELIYMEERQYRYNRPIYYDEKAARENNDTEAFDESKSVVTTSYHYFENGKLFYRSNENGEPEDKTQWERLGREIIRELEMIYK